VTAVLLGCSGQCEPFTSVYSLLRSVFGEVTPIVLTDEFALKRVMSTAATLALVNIVINTALTVVWARSVQCCFKVDRWSSTDIH
jgi:hypothetical protein